MPRRRLPRIPADYLVVLMGLGFRAFLQGGLTVLVARALSRNDYGVSVAVGGIAGFFSVWAGLGASLLHLRDLATAPARWQTSFAHHHGRVVLWQFPLIAMSLLVAWFVTQGGVSLGTLILLVAGELLGAPMADLLVRSYQGRSRYLAMAAAMCALPILRLLLVSPLVLLYSGAIDLMHWAIVVFASGLVLAASALGLARHSRRKARRWSKYERTSVSGTAFAVSAASNRVHADADKVILARMSSMGTAAEYSLAYRIIDILLLPVNSLIEWSARAMFLHGSTGNGHALRVLWTRWVAIGALSIGASAMMFLIAPLLPWIFGLQYEGATTVARWLALLPLSAASWASIRAIAVTTGRESLTAAIEGGGALLNIGLCLVLIGAFDWRGAVLATYATHIVMTVAALLAMRWTARNAKYLAESK